MFTQMYCCMVYGGLAQKAQFDRAIMRFAVQKRE